jgi:hypothetical protein
LINGIAVRPTHELIHKEWSAYCHIQAGIGKNHPSSNGNKADAATLFDCVANPLNGIKNCLEAIHNKSTNMDAPSDDELTTKLETKFDPALITMFKRLPTTAK